MSCILSFISSHDNGKLGKLSGMDLTFKEDDISEEKNQKKKKHSLNFTSRNSTLYTYTATVCFRPKN